MSAFVVDTNVAVVANGDANQAGPDCVEASISALASAREGLIVLDAELRILSEYIKVVGLKGRPGAGHAFVKWVHQNQAVASRCERVAIHSRPGDPESFVEFPDDTVLANFDRSDRKFVAVALASRNRPLVLNAVDEDWWLYREPLQRHGVQIRFVCPGQFAEER